MIILIWLKDALLALMVCTTLASLKNKKTRYLSLLFLVVLFVMGLDIWKG